MRDELNQRLVQMREHLMTPRKDMMGMFPGLNYPYAIPGEHHEEPEEDEEEEEKGKEIVKEKVKKVEQKKV